MTTRQCQRCSSDISGFARYGIRYCSTRCRVAAHRANGIPAEMRKSNRWVRAKGKRPWSINDTPASTTKPATWSSWPLVQKSDVGDGYGIMLGGGLGCYDFDHLGDDEVRRMVAETVTERIVFAERSISGEGVHVFVEAPEGPGRKHGNIERYTWARFIRMTGVRFPL